MTFEEYLSNIKDNSYVLVRYKDTTSIRRVDNWECKLNLMNKEVKPLQYCEDWKYAVEII